MDDQLQAILAPDALGFQDAQESGPFFVVFAVAQLPKQDLAAVCVRPKAHGDEKGAFEATFDRPFATFAVTTHLAIRAQHGHPDGIYLQDGGHILPIAVGIQMDELMQSLVQGAQGQGTDVQVLQLPPHLS
jgi:hypothetical protein